METLLYLMWLHLKIKTLPLEAAKLLAFFGSPKAVYLATHEAYCEYGLSNKFLLRELADKSLKVATTEIEKANALGIQLLGFGTENYPSILYEIPDPPLILYVKGDASVLHQRNTFCIVGTRKCTAYGMSASLGIAEQLARCGMVIVSGVALGIDSGAHRGAVRGGGKTIGIMGCGLDIEYPAGNEEIRKAIIENGALISEFSLGTPPLGSNFPMRNRLLSAFSLGVAVMEAGERSGALITAKYAAEQGRDVFALPGNISSPMSSGTNALIRDGASLLCGADEILAEYILRYPQFFDFQEKNIEEPNAAIQIQIQTEILQSPAVTGEEKQLYSVLKKEPLHINELARISNLDISKVQTFITMLQIKGKVKEHPGNYYSL